MALLHRVLLLCLVVFTSSAVAVNQTWGEHAMPQRQSDVAKTGLQAGNFSAFTNGVVSTTIITLQDLASVPYNNEEIGPAQTHCAESVGLDLFTFTGTGLVQDDEMNMYATFRTFSGGLTNSYSTYTIKLSRSGNDFTPEWVTCTGNNATEDGDFFANPALYKDSSNNTYVILRDFGRTQFALRTSDGGLEHIMVYDPWNALGNVAITPDGVVLQPGDNSNVFITSTDDPLNGTNFTLTQDQGLESASEDDIIRTMGSPNSYVATTSDNDVAFFDNLGQSSATFLDNSSFIDVRNTSFVNVRDVSGLKDGRVTVLHTDGEFVAFLSVLEYDGSNATHINLTVGSDTYIPPSNNNGGDVCEGLDGHVYALDESCSLYRVDIVNASTEIIPYTGSGVCGSSVTRAHYLAANEEGVFFAASFRSTMKRGDSEDDVIVVNGLQYGSSTIEQLGTITIQDRSAYRFGHLVPGAHVALLANDNVTISTVQSMIAISVFNNTLPAEDSSGADGTDGTDGTDGDAASALFHNDWMAWWWF